MPCPHSGGSSVGGRRDDALRRRSFLRAAVGIGGASALAACMERETDANTPTEASFPQGNPDELPETQHAWTQYITQNAFGTRTQPTHHLFLGLDYVGSGPDADEREQVESALRTLESAYQWGTGGNTSAKKADGILFTIGYAPRYFEQYGGGHPEGVDLMRPERLVDRLDEDATVDTFDAVIHITSGYSSIVLAAEEALFGELDAVNGVDVEADLTGVFERSERRAGFVGSGIAARKYDNENIPDNAPLSMGLRGSLGDNQAPEGKITIDDGPWAGSTTQMLSRVENDLDPWYEKEKDVRVDQMFAPEFDVDDVGDVGENLAASTGKTPETVEAIPDDVETVGRLGHGQKNAAARDENFLPLINRRDSNLVDQPGIHFNSLQHGIEDFAETREAMNAEEHAEELEEGTNGILDFIEVTNRATFLIPPRDRRALPTVSS